MSKYLIIILLSLVLINCTSNTIIEKPENLIPKEKMVDLLTDMFLASGARNIKNINDDRKVEYFPLVFEKHHIDSIQFRESSYYYISKIDEYDAILQEVDNRLRKLRTQYELEIEVQDSIKRNDTIDKRIDSSKVPIKINRNIDKRLDSIRDSIKENRVMDKRLDSIKGIIKMPENLHRK